MTRVDQTAGKQQQDAEAKSDKQTGEETSPLPLPDQISRRCHRGDKADRRACITKLT